VRRVVVCVAHVTSANSGSPSRTAAVVRTRITHAPYIPGKSGLTDPVPPRIQ